MTVAPLGLRRVQASLSLAFGADSVCAQHPQAIEKAVGEGTKVVGLSEMSPLGMGPVDTAISWTNEPWNRKWFLDITRRLKRLKEKYKFKFVVGGPGAWQIYERTPETFLKSSPHLDQFAREELGIDHVLEGEVDKIAPDIFQEIEDGSAPECIRSYTNTIASIESIPEITEPTLTALVECMRGCGRGCDFCAPNLRMKRDFPPERVAREASINVKHGYGATWLQSEEITLYGCENKDKWPNEDKILELYGALKKVGVNKIGATHWTFAGVRAAPGLVKKLAELNNLRNGRDWMGVQPGLEFASPRLVKKFMPYKVKPFSPEEYPETVREGLRIMNANHYYPACTLIIGHPTEERDEVRMTINLIRTLSNEDRVHCIFAPLLFVDYCKPSQTMDYDRMSEEHWELYHACWKHNVREFRENVWIATQSFGLPTRLVTILGTYAIGYYILGFLKSQFKKRYGRVPDWM